MFQIPSYDKKYLDEYAKIGSLPNKFCQAIQNDDLDLFSYLINENSDSMKYYTIYEPVKYERSPMLFKHKLTYLDLWAFHGSEKIFNFIMLNDPSYVISEQKMLYSIVGGNSSIIHKCTEQIQIEKKEFLFFEIVRLSTIYKLLDFRNIWTIMIMRIDAALKKKKKKKKNSFQIKRV